MSKEDVAKAIRRALLEGLPANDDGSTAGRVIEVRHCGEITIKVASAEQAPPRRADLALQDNAAAQRIMRPASPELVKRLLSELDGLKPAARTWERPSRIILHPAPWVRAQMRSET